MPVNMSGVEPKKGGAGLLPAGTYQARIINATDAHADSGTDGLEVEFEVVGGDYAGQTIKDTLWFTPKALPYSKFKIEVAGGAIPRGEFEVERRDPDFQDMCRSLMNKRVTITVGMEQDRKDPTKSWPRVKGWDEPKGSGGAASSAGAARRDDDIPF